ncbi:MAG: diacylglycerol kinase [Acidobacteriia bacterium]|nr:diacylglycerol kinase [Terriglobia bacterium]
MRAAVIFGLGTSPADLKLFQAGSTTEWSQGLPTSSGDADAILIFGGDGTIHRHLPALVRLKLPVLIVPSGSGNDFARALKLRSMRDSLGAWRDFESGAIQAQALDLGVVIPSAAPERTHYFCCVAGCGLDSAAARSANRMPRWLRGHGGYALALLPLLARFPAFSLLLTQDTRTQLNDHDRTDAGKLTLLAAFANTQFYGDGMRIAPNADPTDGKLDICRINKLSPLKLLSLFPTVYFGQHLLVPEVEYSRAERVHVQTETPIEIYADGEFVCETPAEISVAAGALRVIYSAR